MITKKTEDEEGEAQDGNNNEEETETEGETVFAIKTSNDNEGDDRSRTRASRTKRKFCDPYTDQEDGEGKNKKKKAKQVGTTHPSAIHAAATIKKMAPLLTQCLLSVEELELNVNHSARTRLHLQDIKEKLTSLMTIKEDLKDFADQVGLA